MYNYVVSHRWLKNLKPYSCVTLSAFILNLIRNICVLIAHHFRGKSNKQAFLPSHGLLHHKLAEFEKQIQHRWRLFLLIELGSGKVRKWLELLSDVDKNIN